jgi:tRNA-specific 2-thiouridylase
VDADKDQTYFLYSLKAADLRRVMFPVGGLRKEQVRAQARELKLKTADKPESQEICFVPKRDYRGFLRDRAGEAGAGNGPIRDSEGKLMGTHQGLENYTIGQRRGLGVAGSSPFYVVGMEGESNTLVVGPEKETYRSALAASNVTWTGEVPREPLEAQARIRHRHPPAPARLIPVGSSEARVEFAAPQRAITPGQAVVFYQDDRVLGGGTIEELP